MPASGRYQARASWAMTAELHEPLRGVLWHGGSYKHLDSANVPWVGAGGVRAKACVRTRAGVLSDGEAHDLAASLYCHSIHSSHPGRRSSRGRTRRVGAHRSVGRALPVRSVTGCVRLRPQRRRDSPWIGTGGRRSAEAALGGCGCRGTRPAALCRSPNSSTNRRPGGE
jgi:hypothetical protein